MSRRWTSVSLKGDSFRIPRLCPSTLRPAEMELRYGYVSFSPLSLWDQFYQTFNYATDAGEATFAYLRYRSKCAWLWAAVIVLVPATFGLALGYASPHPALVFTVWAAPLACVMLGGWLTLRLRRNALRRHPLPKDAVSWRPAAYYVGPGLNLFARRSVFKARRPEWIRALVEANPGAVDNATYARITGSARPAVDTTKPFA